MKRVAHHGTRSRFGVPLGGGPHPVLRSRGREGPQGAAVVRRRLMHRPRGNRPLRHVLLAARLSVGSKVFWPHSRCGPGAAPPAGGGCNLSKVPPGGVRPRPPIADPRRDAPQNVEPRSRTPYPAHIVAGNRRGRDPGGGVPPALRFAHRYCAQWGQYQRLY